MPNLNKNKKEIYNYKIQFKKKGSLLLVSIESLNLFAQGTNFDEAIQNLEKEFQKLKLHYKNFEILDKLKNKNNSNFQYKSMVYFGIKTIIISFAFVFSTVYLVSFSTNKISQISIVEIMKSESNKIKGYLKNEEQNLLKLNDIIMTLKPYLKELKKIND